MVTKVERGEENERHKPTMQDQTTRTTIVGSNYEGDVADASTNNID
jgi:hypothetical protein